MKQYLCYYCDVKSDTFQCIIEHLTSFHKQECLKYRELELNEVIEQHHTELRPIKTSSQLMEILLWP